MNREQLLSELLFKATRSSGPGGQHVNKVSSKVIVSFDIEISTALSNNEKARILEKLAHRIHKGALLVLQCEESRSQHKNKELVIKRLFNLLEEAIKVPKIRRKTKPKKSAIEKRLNTKKKDALKKVNRRKPDLD